MLLRVRFAGRFAQPFIELGADRAVGAGTPRVVMGAAMRALAMRALAMRALAAGGKGPVWAIRLRADRVTDCLVNPPYAGTLRASLEYFNSVLAAACPRIHRHEVQGAGDADRAAHRRGLVVGGHG